MPKPKHDPELLALVGRRLQKARGACGLSQAELAERIPPGAFGPPRWQCVQRQWPIAPRRGLPSSVRVS